MFRNSGWLKACVVALAVLGTAACSKNDDATKQQYFANGNALYDEGKFADAVVEYRNAIRVDERFGEARYKLAEAYAALGNIQRAIPEYIRAADLLPDNVEAQVKAGSVLLLGGRFEDARSRAEKALAADPKSVDAQILLGNATAGMKNLDGAIEEIETAVALAPSEGRGYANLGALQMAKGNADEAEKMFRRAIEVEPGSVAAQLALANFLWGTDRRTEAEERFQAALQIDGKNGLANRALATFYLSGPTPDKAEPYLKTLADEAKEPGPRIALGEYYMRLGRLDDARRELTSAGNVEAGFAPARTRLAALAFGEKRTADAYRLLDEVLEKDPKNVEALVTKGRMLRAEGKSVEALGVLQSAADASPENIAAQFELGLVLTQRNQLDDAVKAFREVVRLNPRAASAHLQLANLYLARGETAQSLTSAEDATRNAPDNPLAQVILARSQMGQGNLTAAAAVLDDLQKKYPRVPVVLNQVGTLRMLQRNNAAARTAFEQSLALAPGDVEAVRGLVALDLMERKPEAAIARVEPLLASSPNNSRLLVEAARAHAGTRNYAKAEELLRRAIQADDTNMPAYGYLGQVFLAQQKLPEALTEFEALSQKQPTSVPAHTMVAMLLQATGRDAEAMKRYERVLEINQEAPVAANNLAWLYAEGAGNIDVALQLAQRARRALPEVAEVADTLGWVHYKKEQYPQAVRELSDAVAKDPENRSYQYRLGLALARSGDAAKARAALQKAVGNGQPFAELEAARKALAELPS